MARPAGAGTSGKGCGIGGLWMSKLVDLGLGRRSRSTVAVSSFKFRVSGCWLREWGCFIWLLRQA